MALSTGAKRGIIIAGTVLLLGGLGVAGYFLFRKPETKPKPKKKKPDPEEAQATTGGVKAGEGRGEGHTVGGVRGDVPQTVGGTRGGVN